MAGNGQTASSSGEQGKAERQLVRVIVAALIVGSLAFALLLDPPDDLPAVALGKEFVYRVEIVLLTFYGGLLLLTPLFYGLIRGKLPIEVSARGAKFSEAADEALGKAEAAIERLQTDSTALRADLVELQLQMKQRQGG